jgi:glycosyltransferase involved in cell wall biosynthesis
MKIACVIPAYNESKSIALVISKLRAFVNEIIVVDDASQDDTYNEAVKAGAIAVRHIINRGQGAALRTGTQLALDNGADIIIHFDADDQFQASDIPEMLKPIFSGRADAVLGSRFLGKKSNIPKFKEYLIMPLARFINRLFFNIHLSDPQSGFRVLSRESALKLKIENDGMAHCSEIIYRLFKNKDRVIEVPITVIYHEFGQKLSGGFKIIRDIVIQAIIKE